MTKAIEKKIGEITHESSRTDIMDLHEKLTSLEDKAQEKYNTEMEKIQGYRAAVDEKSNQTE